jgi:hypothetical protein
MTQYKLDKNQLGEIELALDNNLYVRHFRNLKEIHDPYFRSYPIVQVKI